MSARQAYLQAVDIGGTVVPSIGGVMKLSMGKTRPVDKPYLTVTDGTFTWKVLRAYTADPDKPYARWFCAVSSPFTFGSADWGDTYISDIGGAIIQRDPVVTDADLPSHLRKDGTKSRRQLEAEWDLLI